MNDKLRAGSRILDIPANHNQRRFALLLALLVTLISLAVIPFGNKMLPTLEAFLPILISWLIFSDLLTAYILFSQYRASGVLPLLVLSCTYLFTGFITALHILTSPEVFSVNGMLGADGQTAVWLWIFWHGAFPAGILLYLFIGYRFPDPLKSKRDIATYAAMGLGGTLLLVYFLFKLATEGSDMLPSMIESGHDWNIMNYRIGPVIWFINLAALLMFQARFRARGVLHLWISMALLALLFDILLTMITGGRYSLSWYVSRVDSVIASSVVLCSVINEVNRLFIRLSDQHKQLLESRNQLTKANEELFRLSSLDGLTEIPNRRRLDEIITCELASPERQMPLSLLILDVDYFKAYNDYYGHLGGDHVLQSIARTISEEVKPFFGFAARYGGEEFAVLLSGLDAQGTYEAAEHIRMAILGLAIPHAGSQVAGEVTISVGGYCIPPLQKLNEEEFIELADQCLYEAKKAGRNRCVIKGWSKKLSEEEVNFASTVP